jgi:hypothetical protein
MKKRKKEEEEVKVDILKSGGSERLFNSIFQLIKEDSRFESPFFHHLILLLFSN